MFVQFLRIEAGSRQVSRSPSCFAPGHVGAPTGLAIDA
jgi:hypothetical protein